MARKFYLECEKGYEIGQSLELGGDEFVHAIKVLRHKKGDELCLIDGYGYDYTAVIDNISKNSFTIKIENKQQSKAEVKTNVVVFQALVKGDKFELITQKLTELGVNEIIPFESEFCQVKKSTTRLDRLDKISIEALKQCGRAKKVKIQNVCTFEQMLDCLNKYDIVVFAYEKAKYSLSANMFNEKTKKANNVAIIVGSEGGFSEAEVEELSKIPSVKTVSLGERILRAETASIALTSAVMFCLGEWNLNEWKN